MAREEVKNENNSLREFEPVDSRTKKTGNVKSLKLIASTKVRKCGEPRS